MNAIKKRVLKAIENDAVHRIGRMAGQYVRSKPEDREAIMAGIAFERELADNVQLCLS